MKALVLCAGLGKRLGEHSRGLPKPLVPIGKQPCLYHTLYKLEKLGVKEVLINTHFKHEYFTKSISEYKTGMNIQIDYEPVLLGTAGTLKKHIDWLGTSNFWVLHGDNFFKDDLLGLRDKVNDISKQIKGGLGVFRTSNHKKVGIVKCNKDGTLKRVYEKKFIKRGFLANSAIYYFKPNIKEELIQLSKERRDISVDLLPKLEHKITVVKLNGFFIDIGTPPDLIRAQNLATVEERLGNE
jgi:mannose-1-phosphate guanylyltransferase